MKIPTTIGRRGEEREGNGKEKKKSPPQSTTPEKHLMREEDQLRL